MDKTYLGSGFDSTIIQDDYIFPLKNNYYKHYKYVKIYYIDYRITGLYDFTIFY